MRQKRTNPCFRGMDWRPWFLLLNIYNVITEKKQVIVLKELTTILTNFGNIHTHNLIFAGDFNIFCYAFLEVKGGTPTLKSRSINKLIELNGTLDLRDIWRIINHKKYIYTFRQKHLSGIIQWRLHYILISQYLQEYVKKSDVLTALSTDHSLVFLAIIKTKWIQQRKRRRLVEV